MRVGIVAVPDQQLLVGVAGALLEAVQGPDKVLLHIHPGVCKQERGIRPAAWRSRAAQQAKRSGAASGAERQLRGDSPGL